MIIRIIIVISGVLLGILTLLSADSCNKRKDLETKHQNQLQSVLDSTNRVQLELVQNIEAYKEREQWVIDSAKKEGIKQGRIRNITNVGVKIEYRDTGIVQTDTIYKDSVPFIEYQCIVDTSCFKFGFYTNSEIWPRIVTNLDVEMEYAQVEYSIKPKNWFWKLRWNKNKWPKEKRVYVNCGKLIKNINTEIK